jgi:UDP-N-acetylmuramate dehydrogenase
MNAHLPTADTDLELATPAALGIEIRRGVSLAPLTTMKVGGPAELFASVATLAQLLGLVRWAQATAQPYCLLGGGSNVLISDAGVRGLVIFNRCRGVQIGQVSSGSDESDQFVGFVGASHLLQAESGALMAGVARRAVAAGLTGLEWAVSLPGTVGGAVVNNAGAYGWEIKDNLESATVLDAQGSLVKLTPADASYAYRTSSLKRTGVVHAGFGPVVLDARFLLAHGDPAVIAAQAERNLLQRRHSQPNEPSLGSTFRNPPGDSAGRLIEAADLKGERRGGVEVSRHHANFLINPGGVGATTAADVMALIRHVQQVVLDRCGMALETEVQLVGEWE